ncbi:unnamed protein product [Lactuca saligna]|uniref:Peptidase A1 domain-containing protein n=1 Tax=Lactuca saligna TaxID=75948 RepID=A0AA35ZFN0_LACSI|nr:unnamed protein product [Lactuca saligna]
MKALALLHLLLTLSVSLSTSNHHSDGSSGGGKLKGFTADLIHRDSPLSPLYNPTHSRSNRVQNAFNRSISRASTLSRRAGFTTKIEANIYEVPGEYIMSIQIGTPPVKVLGVADTGSDLTWAQCQPCQNCYKQISVPYLVPSSSSTYQQLSCQSKGCEALEESQSACDSQNTCHYKMMYGDRSYTSGDLAMDTFWFGLTHMKNVVFGCGHDNNGTFNENVSGIIGLGGGQLSVVNQLNSVVKGQFSYCLIPHFNDITNQTSKIYFGDLAKVNALNVVSTPIVPKEPSTYYYLTLQSVLVGNTSVSYERSFSRNKVVKGNIVIDSGTTLTLVNPDFYSALTSALTDAIGVQTVQDPQGLLEVCYRDLELTRVPNMTFRFDGADVELPATSTFLEVQKGLSCLTIVPADGLAIFGNLLQQNLLVGYDLVNERVYFKPTDCMRHVVG